MGATHRHEKMRAITHCPVCQTQFFVSDEQLNQHHGQVRCGHCLHVFDAQAHTVSAVETSDEVALTESTAPMVAADAELIIPSNTNTDLTITEAEVSTYLASGAVEAAVLDINPVTEAASIAATAVDNTASIPVEINSFEAVQPTPAPEAELAVALAANIDETVSAETENADALTAYFDDATEAQSVSVVPGKKSRVGLTWLLSIVLLLLAMLQTLYFLRNPIATYYPNFKPYLERACQPLGCSIDLPKKIELIVIDDSDMQEDADHAGLIRLTTSLINQAGFAQAYPNLELTLTDLDDKPTLRRLFKPDEYLPAHSNIKAGIASAEEVKVKLAIAVDGMPVAGYRVFVTY